jgi:tetratricopeptide (TPR) repeat protein
LNYRVSDQSRNYTAYEHALNISRTVEPGDTILVKGDNNSFPLIYGWLAEKMGEHVDLRDGQNLMSGRSSRADGKASGERGTPVIERMVMRGTGESRIFLALFDSSFVAMPPSHVIIPYGVLHLAVKKPLSSHKVGNMWRYYSTESFHESFHRDFMNRQIYGHFSVRLAQHLFASGNAEAGKRIIGDASRGAFDDYGVHLAASAVLIHEGMFDMAKEEIEKAGLYGAPAAIIHNHWGCYYFKKSEYEAAVESFRISLWFGGRSPVDYKNLLQALEKAGRLAEAVEVREEMTQRFPGVLEGENAGRQGLSQ